MVAAAGRASSGAPVRTHRRRRLRRPAQRHGERRQQLGRLPGHGDPFRDKDRLRKYQSYLRDLWKQAGDLKKQGLSPDDAAKKIDLTSHKGDFPNIQGPGVDPRAMLRIYDVIDGRMQPR
jgi:hypothetical protein